MDEKTDHRIKRFDGIAVQRGSKSCKKVSHQGIYVMNWKMHAAGCLSHLLKAEGRPRCRKASKVHAKVFPCHEGKREHMGESLAAHLFGRDCDGAVEGCHIACIEVAYIVLLITFFIQRFKDVSHTVFAGVNIVLVVNVRKNVLPLCGIATNVLKYRKARPGEFTDEIGEDTDIMLFSSHILP